MTASKGGTMPAPYSHIELRVAQFPLNDFWIEYTGTPHDLVAAGVVDARMVEQILNKRHGAKMDANRVRFTLLQTSMSAREAWETNQPLVFRRCPKSAAQALAMPEVRELFPEGIADLVAAAPMPRPRHDGWQTRSVGFRQRRVLIRTIESVIFVDWQAVRAGTQFA